MNETARENGAAVWPVLLLALVAFAGSALPPLHEMDLAQHLANGEWIWRNRAVPFTEPFAWTRAGEPYYAYSWLPSVIYYGLLRWFGPVGLHLLEGALAVGAVLAMLWAGSQFRWPRPVRYGMAVLHLAFFWGLAGTIRPQQFLLVAAPLAWGVAASIRSSGNTAPRLVALAGIGMLAANTHLFFPLTAIPIAYWLIADRQPRRWLAAGSALLLGWLLSPYGLAWPQVFALNFGHNLMLARPPSIAEFVPAFEYARHRPGALVAAAVLLVAPWLALRAAATARERVAAALCWTAGLLLFMYAGRLVLVWWLLALPLVAEAGSAVTAALAARLRPRFGALVAAGAAAVVLVGAMPSVQPAFWAFEGDVTHRMLPRAGEDPALWLPSWLLCHTRPGAGGRLFNEFNYGSELTWRLPGYAPSIDGRTIFPDSVAFDFSMQPAGQLRVPARPWRHADLALLDLSFRAGPEIDRDPEWLLLATSQRTSRGRAAALWARRGWWERWGTASELPVLDVGVGDERASCAASGYFPK